MKLNKILLVAVLQIAMNCFAQNSVTEIKTKDGVHYITNAINYPIMGTYFFNGAEPIVELNTGGMGVYQLHEQPKRTMTWGIECNEAGEPKFIKGFNSAEYYLWYKCAPELNSDAVEDWTMAEFSIHFNSMKMYIQGERVKDYSDKK